MLRVPEHNPFQLFTRYPRLRSRHPGRGRNSPGARASRHAAMTRRCRRPSVPPGRCASRPIRRMPVNTGSGAHAGPCSFSVPHRGRGATETDYAVAAYSVPCSFPVTPWHMAQTQRLAPPRFGKGHAKSMPWLTVWARTGVHARCMKFNADLMYFLLARFADAPDASLRRQLFIAGG